MKIFSKIFKRYLKIFSFFIARKKQQVSARKVSVSLENYLVLCLNNFKFYFWCQENCSATSLNLNFHHLCFEIDFKISPLNLGTPWLILNYVVLILKAQDRSHSKGDSFLTAFLKNALGPKIIKKLPFLEHFYSLISTEQDKPVSVWIHVCFYIIA